MKAHLYKAYKGFVENVLPPLSHSQFKEKGVLTPEEFVLAGDYLVQTCPTWFWEGGDVSKRKPFLSPEKQFLITRNVPCLRRASAQLEYAQYTSPSTTGDDVEGGDWVATTSAADVEEQLDSFEELPDIQHTTTSGIVPGSSDKAGGGSTGADKGYIPDIDDDDEERQAKLRHTAQAQSGGGTGEINLKKGMQEERIPDISDLDLNDEEDDAVAPLQPVANTTTGTATPSSGVIACRTYDILISYDNYYRVPRVWLIGYSEDRTPLTQSEVMEDVMSDYFSHKERKTVTAESHPHRTLGGKVVSIHPCRHAETMHRLAARVSGGNGGSTEEEVAGGDSGDGGGGGSSSKTKTQSQNEFKIEHYMVLFLKFISSVVPTIEYDYTMPVGM